MSPSLALFLWLVLLLLLLRCDPAKHPGISATLWVPLTWMFIVGTRLPSQWLGETPRSAAEAYLEGNALDRTVLSILILLAIGILVSRSFQWDHFSARNFALLAFVGFALLSVVWSDYPFVSFKRWFRDLGNYLMPLVVLSDPRPREAVRMAFRRLCYLLIPLSILLIKYYPDIGRQYSQWTGIATYVGPTTSKNMLGVLCLVSGIFFFWDTMTRWPDRKERRTKLIVAVNIGFIAMTLWLLNLADSATSRVCLVIGCLAIGTAHLRSVKRHPAFLTLLVPACFCLYLILALGFGISAEIAGTVGRDPTLTGRTDLWRILLNMNTNSLVGAGYESFWLGPRLEWVSQRFASVNEAHNGYLEVYLNLGLIGVCLLGGFLIASYRSICKRFKSPSSLASLSLALWTVLVFYNVTEASFDHQLMWATFLLGAIAVPARAKDGARSIASSESADGAAGFRSLPAQTIGLRR